MHPLLARGERLALYLAVWASAGVLLMTLLARQGGLGSGSAAAVAFPLVAIYAFVCLSGWYVARSTPLSTSGAVRIVGTALGASLLSASAWLLAARVWIAVVERWWSIRAPYVEIAPTLFGYGALLYLLSITVGYSVAAFEHARAAERRELQAQVLSRDAELRSLRSQIDPHFLFNSLHSISALTGIDAAGARRMTVLLGDFLRESLALGAAERIPLARELALAGKYLEIERVRLGERLQVQLDGGNAGECLVPPLLLQPIAENAVTHGVAHVLAGGTVLLSARATPLRLHIIVENPADADRPRKTGTGVGLANVRARLRALYGSEASVQWAEQDGRWRVELDLPAVRATSPRAAAEPSRESEAMDDRDTDAARRDRGR